MTRTNQAWHPGTREYEPTKRTLEDAYQGIPQEKSTPPEIIQAQRGENDESSAEDFATANAGMIDRSIFGGEMK